MVSAEERPLQFRLAPAMPNPFNPATELSFELDEIAEVELSVYSLQGVRVARLASGRLDRGTHRFSFQAGDLPSGTYLARLSSRGRQQTQKLLLLK